ncbi:DUF4942 domain-containing protein [Tunicatimonas pelagia]|uniref:DUF4942 domain-containing protein n=1 Tax=Tunicatimonas pelagia TaxID=931531 RepID=UPI0026665286|nr:DUF4942 domain-containing protein [Tunicatimonas pelagia]WKN46455.1 DUF4942 domain-containing protein [Tunicatimonas pelagia]
MIRCLVDANLRRSAARAARVRFACSEKNLPFYRKRIFFRQPLPLASDFEMGKHNPAAVAGCHLNFIIMFGKEFYPTPQEVIEKMLAPYRPSDERFARARYKRYTGLQGKTILDPSAGKGDLLDFITENTDRYDDVECFCCEVHPELQNILRQKDYQLIQEDFLSYQGDYFFDLIVMNPPFSNGDEHLLKAWQILKEGDIVCLFNSETINNPYTQRRQHLKEIIEMHGEVEDLGQVFLDAERKTAVRCSIVRLHKDAEESVFDFSFDTVTRNQDVQFTEETMESTVATRDVVENMATQQRKLQESYLNLLRAYQQMKFYSQGIFKGRKSAEEVAEKARKKGGRKGYNYFLAATKQEMWQCVLNAINMDQFMTHQVRQDFESFSRNQGHMDFTKENVASLVAMLFENRYTILDRAVVNVFDIFTSYHQENRLHVEGWKTNDRWKVNRKIILPYWIKFGEYDSADHYQRYGSTFSTSYSHHSEYSDVDKVMCYLKGIPYERCQNVYDTLDKTFKQIGKIRPGDKVDNTCESEFFHIKFFKKGTIHLGFKDTWLWDEFNLRACAGKQWLPEAEKQSARRTTWNETKQQDQLSLPLAEELSLGEQLSLL